MKLNTTIYRLTDASHSLYKSIKNKLFLGVSVNKLDLSVFIWNNEDNLEVMCANVDDFLFGGPQLSIKNIN